MGGGPGAGYGGFNAPDVVANLRVDQAWGSAQVMGALHEVNATYYTGPGFDAAGHPDVEWGWAAGAGLKLNAPMIGHGDYFQAEFDYAEGAEYYVFSPQVMNRTYYEREGNFAGYGVMSDAVYGGVLGVDATNLNLTTTWGAMAAFEHHWNDQWKTSVYGGYQETKYNDQANAILCSLQGQGTGGTGANAVADAGCDNDWNSWFVGSRTQWNVSKDFYMGVDVMYHVLQSGSGAGGLLPTGLGTNTLAQRGATYVDDQDIWRVEFRVHKDFYP